MKPSPRKSPSELLEWAVRIVQREQQSQIFGTITIHLQKGQIIRVSTERNELPENIHQNAIDINGH